MSTVIARQVIKVTVPLIIVVAINFFLQGHNRPGGGFIAGVMTSSALALLYIVLNIDGLKSLRGSEDRLFEKYLDLGVCGVLLAAGVSTALMGLGIAFMNHRKGIVHLPIFGSIHWTTAVVFDLGVYFAVLGSTMTIFEVMSRE